jgi:uncharacterized phiE125 gp8 family phage protein
MLKLIASEPVSLAEAKLHLKLSDIPEDSSEDTLITDLISVAREYCEKYTGRDLTGKTYEYYLDSFPATDIEIEASEEYPVSSVVSIIYTEYDKDEKEVETTVDSSIYFLEENTIKLLEGNSWPTLSAGPDNPIKITYKVGVVPKSVGHAMLLLIGFWHANREAVLDVKNKSVYAVQVPFSAKALLDQYRDRWWD